MPSFSYNIDKCFFSKRDTSLFIEGEKKSDQAEKSQLVQELAPKHKVTAVEFNATKPLDIEDIIQSLYYEVEVLIGFDVERSLSKYSDEKKMFVLIELLKDCAVIVHSADKIDPALMVQLQRLSLTLKRHTRSRLRLVFILDVDVFDHSIDAGMRLEYVKFYFSGVTDDQKAEVRHAADVEIKLERRGIERFLGDYIETVKLRPRVKSFLGNI